MARGINTRITLVGGDEVKRQLTAMGKDGEAAILAMDRAVNSANTDLGRFAATAAAARASIATMNAALHASFATAGARLGNLHGAVQNFSTAMGASASAIIPFNTNMVAMAGALTAALAPLALFAQAKKAALATDSLVDTAENLNTSTEVLLAMRQVSEASGGSFDLLENAMQKSNRTLGEAASKTKGYTVALEGQAAVLRGNAAAGTDAIEVIRVGQGALTDVANEWAVIANLAGTTIQNLTKMKLEDRLLLAGKAIARVKDETEQARLANAVWGKSYRDMLPALRDAATQLKPAIARVKEFKQGVTDAEKAQSEGFLQALARTNTAMGRMFTTLGGTLGTTMVPVFKEIERVIVTNRAALQEWATSIASQVMPVVQDFVALVRGDGNAALKTNFVKGLVSAFEQVRDGAIIAFNVITAGFLVIANVLEPVAAGLNVIFGTAMTGKALAIGAAVFYVVGGFTALAAGIALVKAAILVITPILGAIAAIPLAITIGAISVAIVALNTDWGLLSRTVQAFWEMLQSLDAYLGGAFSKTVDVVKNAVLGMIPGLKLALELRDAIARGGDAWGPVAAEAPIPAAAEQFDAHVQSLKNATAANTETLKKTVTDQTEVLKQGVQNGVNVISGAVGKVGVRVEAGVTVISGSVKRLGASFTEAVEEGVNVIRGPELSEVIKAHIEAFTKALQEENRLIKQSIDLISGLLVAQNDAARHGTANSFSGQGVGGGGSNILPFASGGFIRGPGTSTSDSILARLSDREYVIRAAAVKHFGVGFFDALNRLRTPKFSLGGLAEGMSRSLLPAAPRFAAGGMATVSAGGGRSAFTIVLDQQSFRVSGGDEPVERLGRLARRRSLLSGGRKPSHM